MVIARRNLMAGKALPYDAEVEWLESNHNAWIDSGVKAKLNTSSVFEMMFTGGIGNCAFGYSDVVDGGIVSEITKSRFTLFRSWFCSYCYFLFLKDGVSTIRGSVVQYGRPIDINKMIKCDISFRKCNVQVEGMVVSGIEYGLEDVESGSESERTIKIFAGEQSNGFDRDIAQSRFYYCIIRDGGSVVRDFIPVRFTNERGVSEGAMYDRVSGNLFRNAGTGAFVIGPDKVGTELAGGGV